ncbi:hypothetical protein [Vibrio sp. HN007]|uniref:hypothetical protein n=1 Tax=Vibrio iocasae TaxID=3098914 RepID=UPI0035D4F7CB
MNKLESYIVGLPYSGQLPNLTAEGGAVSEFLRPSNTLLIVMPDISDYESKTLSRGDMRCGLLAENGAILLLWQFKDRRLKVTTLDSPFDARLIPDLEMDFLDTPNANLVIEVHIVDSRTKRLRGFRKITMPTGLTKEFYSAVKEQVANPLNGNKQMQIWMQEPPHKLVRKTRMWKMGE